MSPYDQKFLKGSMTRHYIHSYKLPLNLIALQSHLKQKFRKHVTDLFPCGQMPFDPSAETCLFGDVGTFGSVLDWLTQKGELSPR